jgi:uncharacterized metal-binding protein
MEIKELYTSNDIKTMHQANEARLPGKNRIEELKSFAKVSGIKRIGIANCVAVQKESDQLKEILSADFEVSTVNCKYQKIQNAEMLGGDVKGISCNPAGQAAFLGENNTELNIVMGLCVGHDMVFTARSKAPSTTLIVKDREFRHNPIEAFNEKI